ncbi:hypothetical protein LTR10_003513 [Elasticomyces elasticus]|nr:hypothetical protein LTR10_003513 [Elasticomyces elasticus]KAK4969781.1 hypothetical protein LTR42_009053 [Elasticomyces elasticus]
MTSRPYTKKPVTDIFTGQDTDIDRRNCHRVVPMRILALGLGRTGTASLRIALKELGFDDCYHMMSASVENPPDCLMWSDAFAAKYDGKGTFSRKQWDQLLGHCQAVCDWPAIAFSRELIAAYPEAKVILTTRNVDSWHASTLQTVHWRATEPGLRWTAKVDWAASMYHPMLTKFWRCFWDGDFDRNGKRRFAEHYEEVRQLVPPNNLLEFHISSGWGPLCEFLDVPTPKTAFPRTNDTSGFIHRCQRRNSMQMMNGVCRFVVLLVMLVVALAVLSALSRGRRLLGTLNSRFSASSFTLR